MMKFIPICEEIANERYRQIAAEGWSYEHDDTHTDGSLGAAAACYAHPDTAWRGSAWPKSWASRWYKPTHRRRDLIKAAALIVAEIERLDRMVEYATDRTN